MVKVERATKKGRGVSPIYLDEDDQAGQSDVIYARAAGGGELSLDGMAESSPILIGCCHYCPSVTTIANRSLDLVPSFLIANLLQLKHTTI